MNFLSLKESMDIDESTERIMERVRQRKLELGGGENDEGKENISENLQNSSSAAASNSSWKCFDSQTEIKRNVQDDQFETSPTKKSAFDVLAEEYNDLEECSPRKEKPKEAYLKGRSPRLSIGETRASVLCVPHPPGTTRSPLSAPGSATKEDRDRSPMKSMQKSPQKAFLSTVDEENRRIRFAHPVAAITTFEEYSSSMYSSTTNSINESSIVAGSGYTQMMPDNFRNVNVFTSEANSTVTDHREELSSDEYGAHTFIKKKTPTKSSSTSSLKVCSPKPFTRGCSANSFSPVHFNPVTTSSPKIVESTATLTTTLNTEIAISDANLSSVSVRKDFINELEERAKAASSSQPTTPRGKVLFTPSREPQPDKTMSPVRSAALESARATTIAQQLEQKLRGTNVVPKPTVQGVSVGNRNPVTPTVNNGLRTQFRGTQGTPVVAGADPSEPAGPDPSARASNLKSLKSRWEFSSLTGTPIHPDASEDALVTAAIRMRDTAIPRKDGKSLSATNVPVTRENPAVTPRSERKTYGERADLVRSPAAKSPRYEATSIAVNQSPAYYRQEQTAASPYQNKYSRSPSPQKRQTPHKSPKMQEPEMVEREDTFADNEESEDGVSGGSEGANMSRFIDDQFDFMGKSPALANQHGSTFSTPARQPAPTIVMEESADDMEESSVLTGTSSPNRQPVDDTYSTPSTKSAAGTSLPYTVSFYRKRGRMQASGDPTAEKVDLSSSILPSAPMQQIIGGNGMEEDHEDIGRRKAILEERIREKQTQIVQASNALQLCKANVKFRGSREEIVAHRVILEATEKRHATIKALDRLNRGEQLTHSGPLGAITISSLAFPLNREFSDGSHGYGQSSDTIVYFIALLKCRERVEATPMVTSDEVVAKKGLLEFNHYVTLENLSPDFCCVVEVYALRTMREQFTHEEKYSLKGTSSKNSKTLSRSAGYAHRSAGGPSAVCDSSFQLVGRTSLDINTNAGKKPQPQKLQDVKLPLEGIAYIKMKKRCVGRSDIQHDGFLSMYQKTKDGLGSWKRYWCVMEAGEMKFWSEPDDIKYGKNWLVLLDLQTCTSDGASTVRDICPYPNSFHIDVWVPKDTLNTTTQTGSGRPEMEKLRVMLAADTKPELSKWLQMINLTTRDLLTWNKPFA